MKVDIVIVNWNAGPLLRQALVSIREHGAGWFDKVVVVDNGSIDGSADVSVEGLDPHIIKTGENLGFGKASNLGAAEGGAPYILFLNPDAALLADSLQKIVIFMERHDSRDIGACGVKLIGDDGTVQFHCARRPDWRAFFGHSIGADLVLPTLFPPTLLLDFDHLEERDVDHVIGAFYLVRRSTFEAVGGFDERFFVYLEDLDLSLRIKDFRQRVHYLPTVEAFHKGGGTSEKVKAARLFYSSRSQIIFSFKHFNLASACVSTAALLLLEPFIRTLRAVMRGSLDELRDTWAGFFMLYRDLPHVMRLAASVRQDDFDSGRS